MIKRMIKVLLCVCLVAPCFFAQITPTHAASNGVLNVNGVDIWGIIQDGYKSYKEWAANNRQAAADFFQGGLDGAYRLVKGILGANSVYADTQKKILDHSLKCFAEGNYTSCKYVDARVKENEADGRYTKGYSGGRNYYTGGNGTIYNSGDTVYNNFVNTTNKTYTYVTNNNEYVTNNYTNMYYDIKNNYYYTTNNNYTYKYQYTYNYTYYTMIDSNGQEASKKYYFELPDGRSSFNMTEDDIKGFVLNYNITNYDTVYDNDRTLALYHFNGDTYDSGINNLPLNWVSGASTDYLTVDSNFEGYLFLDNQTTHEFTIPVNYDGEDWSVEWRMYISGIKKFINSAYSGESFYHVPNSNQFASLYTFFRASLLKLNNSADVSFVTDYSDVGLALSSNFVVDHPSVTNTDIPYTYTATKDILVRKKGTLNYDQWNYVSFPPKYTHQSNFNADIPTVNLLSSGSWASYSLEKKGNVLYLYMNGVLVDKIDDFNKKLTDVAFTFQPSTTQSFYYFDELRISGQAVHDGASNYIPSSTQFDTNLVYVLPDVSPENHILIKSVIPITSQQFGGVRSSAPVKGDVYVPVSDDYTVVDVQQYNGADWVEVPASVYYGGAWVDIKGFSLKTQEPTPPDDPDVTPTPTPGGGSGGGGAYVPGDPTQSATNIWDVLVALINKAGDILSGTADLLGSLVSGFVNLLGKLFIPSSDFFTNLMQTDFPELKLKLGFLSAPFDIFTSVLHSFDNISDLGSYGFSWPDVSIPGFGVLIPAGGYSFDDLLANEVFSRMRSLMLTIDNAVIWLAVVNLARKKLDGFMRR